MIQASSSRSVLSGLLAIDKPWGWSSHDVVSAVRRAAHTSAVGHAGTLDPLASGVLVVALGPATRVLDAVMDLPKCYVAEIRLGVMSATDDAEGPPLAHAPEVDVSRDRIEAALAGFVGDQEQRPPSFAAIKVAGRPAYATARQGKDVPLAARRVTIYALALLRVRLPALTVAVWCSKGAYIRALARDLGVLLQTGAYLAGLVRTAIGPFVLRDSLSMSDIAHLGESNRLAEVCYTPETALAGRSVLLACGAAAEDLKHGRSVAVESMAAPDRTSSSHATSWALGPEGRLLALGECRARARLPQSATGEQSQPDAAATPVEPGSDHIWHPHKVFVP